MPLAVFCRRVDQAGCILGTLHWPVSDADLGVGGVSYVELLVLHEPGAGERLVLEKAVPRGKRPGRPISVSAVPRGPGIDIWRSCRFLVEMLRALGTLHAGPGRAGFCLAVLGPTIVSLGILVRRSAAMGLPPGPLGLRQFIFRMSF